MQSFDIYKIAENLSPIEQEFGVIRINPIWGNRMTPLEYFKHMQPRVECGRRLLLPGELGCALAHNTVYQKIAKSGRGSVILEEDIDLKGPDVERLKAILSWIRNPDFINFAHYRHSFHKKDLHDGLFVADTSEGFWGASAYFVSPNMAGYLLNLHSNFIDISDNWQEVFVGCRFVPFYVPLFEHAGDSTTINHRESSPQNPSLLEVLKLRVLRRRMRLLGNLRHRRNIFKAKRKYVSSFPLMKPSNDKSHRRN